MAERRSFSPTPAKRRRGATLIATLAFSVVAFGVGVFACRKTPPTSSGPTPSPSASVDLAGAKIDPRFCGAGLVPIPGGACFSAPPGTGDFPLVVYLHGLHDDTTTLSDELARQARVAALGAKHVGRFGVLAFHGKKGDCTLRRVDDLYCWPSNDRTAGEGPAVAASFARALDEAAARGARGPRFLLGFSNGGYFAMLVAERALLPFDAVVVAHGGPMPPTERPAKAPALLLLTADDDAAVDDMMRLSQQLGAVQWPHKLLSRDGVHALPESDVTTALDFFQSVATKTTFVVPASAHPPHPVARPDAGADSTADEPVADDTATARPGPSAAESTPPAAPESAPSAESTPTPE